MQLIKLSWLCTWSVILLNYWSIDSMFGQGYRLEWPYVRTQMLLNFTMTSYGCQRAVQCVIVTMCVKLHS